MNTFYGYSQKEFIFEGKKAIVVFPQSPDENKNVALKTEYWNAFPTMELALLQEGFHLAYVQNENRWATEEDSARKARFVDFLTEEYGLRNRCLPVGMSCGGAHGVNFAGRYPEKVWGLLLDAPVLNFCSCPGYLGREDRLEGAWDKEFVPAYPGMTKDKLLSFPHHPINRAPVLTEHKIPLVMIYGTEDLTVPYRENGALLEEAYKRENAPILVLPQPCRGHHPHGVPDIAPILHFFQNYL